MSYLLDMDKTIQDKISNNMKTNVQNIQEKRLIELNDSYRKRYLDYIKIVMIAMIGCFFVWIVRVIDEKNLIPTGFQEFIIIIAISICSIYIYIVWTSIQTHDLLNYDTIEYSHPDTSANTNRTDNPTLNPSVVPTSTATSTTAPPSSAVCSNPICPTGYVYSSKDKTCIVDSSQIDNIIKSQLKF